MSFLDAFRRKRQPMDERLPDGRSVYEAIQDQQSHPYSQQQTQHPNRKGGLIFNPGTGFEEVPYDSRYPDEIPQQTKRRLENAAIWRRSMGTEQRGQMAPEDFRGEVSANFPVSGIGTVRNDGYGAGYQKGPLDVGYQRPQSPFIKRLTERNQESITRPRRVSPFVDRFAEGQTRPRIADPTSFDAEHLREIESKPLGLRGKAGLVAQNIATNLGYHPLQTRRQRDVGEMEGRLGRDIALDKNRVALEQGQMVPFQLPDGTWTQVPAKSAAVLASRQQGQQGTLSIRRQQMESHNKRWDTMAKHEAAQDAQRLYNSGAADDNEDLRDAIAARMGLPAGTKLPPSTQGQLAVDANGNYILVNKRTGEARPAMAGEKPVASMQSTLEAGRNRRAAAAQVGANQRAAMRQTTTGQGRKITPPERRDMAETAAVINSVHRKLTAIDDQIKNEKDPNKLRVLQNRRQGLVEEGALNADKMNRIDPDNEWGSGTGGYPYTKPRAQQAPSDLEKPIYGKPTGSVTEQQIRDAAKAKGLDPNTAVERARKRGLIQ
jgi:hypothetical protein